MEDWNIGMGDEKHVVNGGHRIVQDVNPVTYDQIRDIEDGNLVMDDRIGVTEKAFTL